MKEKNIGFECVLPSEQDAQQIMEWRNDPMTLNMSIHTQPKNWKDFFPEFLSEYFPAPDLPPLFALFNGQRVAFLRFKPIEHPEHIHNRRCVEISINVAPQYRHQGLGTAILLAANDWIKRQGFDDLFAQIKVENVASHKAFIAAGYEKLADSIKTIDETQQQVAVTHYILRLTPPSTDAVFVVAEAGSNWRVGSPEKDIEMAKSLIEVAAHAGVDAVKFQIFRPETIYVANAGESQYLHKAGIEQDMHELFAHLSMPYEMIPELARYCQKLNVEFMASAFSKNDFLAIDPYVKRHKIASYEIGHIRLIELAARSQKPTLISTGAANEEEIAWAVQTFYAAGGPNLSLLQCTAKYPAEVDSMNLRTILWLKNRFKCKVGLSDHSRHPTAAPVAAIALGARFIEKHFTMDQKLPGPDHAFALMPDELKEMVSAIRRTELMLGSWVKNIHPCEQELRSFARRGIQALRHIQKGEILQEGVNIDILRPGQQTQGLHPKNIIQIEGKKATRSIPSGSGLQLGDWE